MRLLVVGASGAVGSSLVQLVLALDRGHEVRAYVRNPDKLGATADRAQIDVLLDSSVDWVVACCPDMTSKPTRGSVLARQDEYPGFRVTRADLAAFLLDQLTDDTWLRQAPIVASG